MYDMPSLMLVIPEYHRDKGGSVYMGGAVVLCGLCDDTRL